MSIVGINGVYAPNQKIIKGDKGNDFNIDDYSDGLHIINIPTASPTSRGLLSAADYVFFSGGASPVLSSGSIWIGSVTNTPVPQIMSGDATISNTGVLTLNANVVRTTGSYADPVWITSLSGSKITGNITGNAANVTGIVPLTNGGSGANTAANARTNLGLGSFSTVSSNSIMTGYVQIGDDAAVPLEKHRTITGTTANSQGNQVFVTHGCPDPTKIISIRTFVDLGGGSNIYITSGYRYSTGYEFSERVSNTEIVISNVTGNSGNILNLPFKTLIIYRQ